MAVTSTRVLSTAEDGTRMVHATVTMDSSYAAGGEPVTAGDLGLQYITGAIVGNAFNATPAGMMGAWDQANKKILAFKEAGSAGFMAEASGDLSALTFNCIFFGV